MLCVTRYQGSQADVRNTGVVTASIVTVRTVGLTRI